MHVSGFDGVLWLLASIGQLLLLSVLIFRRRYKEFPIFTCLVLWAALSDPLLLVVLMTQHDVYSLTYYRTYFTFNILEYALELAVLVEVAADVLRPVRKSLPKGILFILLGCMAVVGFAGFFFAAHLNASTLTHPRAFIVMDASVAIMRLVTFLAIAAFSQVLGIGWKNHILQLASGLAFYAAVSLIVALAHSFLRAGPDYSRQYFAFDHLRIGGYLCALYYWCYSFARQEAPRKEFSPQMAQLLVSIAGNTKRQQSLVARSIDKTQ
jgi:hypothetical protein